MTLKKKQFRKKDLDSISSKRPEIKKFIREFLGFLPYEKKIYEYLSIGKDKKALRVAKKKLGNTKRAKKKRDSVNFLQRKKVN
jgi:hypothetical protein